MSTAQWLYATLAVMYIALFLVFARIFYWKHYADQNYYKRRPAGLSHEMLTELAAAQSRSIPRFSIFIPARNEADVVEKTIDHLAHLTYSPDHYEILVVTDQKEAFAADEERKELSSRLLPFLAGHADWQADERCQTVLTALLAQLALDAADVTPLQQLSQHEQVSLLHEVALELVQAAGRVDHESLRSLLARRKRELTQADIEQLYPSLLTLALTVADQALQLTGQPTIGSSQSPAGQVGPDLSLKAQIAQRLAEATAEQLEGWLAQAYPIALPTTQEIVVRKQVEFSATPHLPPLKHVEVPYDFDGYIDGQCIGTAVPSTKGRALNWAFRFADPRNELWAFYDAESRPENQVLLYVAWRRLMAGDKFQIAQGPVYQIRNFWKTGPLSKIAGLYQAVSHEWQMPWLLRQIPFIGGTNIFSTRELMLRIGGFDDTVLTEDMELGARAWLKGDAWPEFLPYASSEQTPPTYKAFFRQRLRWGAGYLQVYDKIKADPSLPADKKNYLIRIYWWKGHFSWTLFQGIALLPFVVIPMGMNGLLDQSALPSWFSGLILLFAPCYLLFTIASFFHYRGLMDPAPKETQLVGFAQLFLLPLSALFLPVPYTSALVLKAMGRAPKAWVKTPRTKE